MANTNIKDFQSNVISQLGTYTYNVLVAGLYDVATFTTLPLASSLSVVINLNGSPIASSSAPTPPQLAIELQALDVSCAISDVITIVYSSSAQVDALPNQFKSILTLTQSI